MFSYPNNFIGPCINNTNITNETRICRHGSCPEIINIGSYNGACQCDPYYNPLTNCEDSIFLVLGSLPIIWFFICIFINIIQIVFTSLELQKNCLIMKHPWRNDITYSLIGILFYAIFKFTAAFLFLLSWARQNSEFARVEQIIQLIALVIFTLNYGLCVASWFKVLIKAKELGKSSKFAILLRKIIYISGGILSFIALISQLINIFIGYSIFGIVAVLAATLLVCGISIINIVQASIIIHWIKKDMEIFNRSIILQEAYTKTVIILVETLWMIFCMVAPIPLSTAPASLPNVIIFRQFMTLASESTNILGFFIFLQNWMYKNGKWLSYHTKDLNITTITPSTISASSNSK